ncbi:MAG: alpha-galactosidase [Planctomycetota bacterium]
MKRIFLVILLAFSCLSVQAAQHSVPCRIRDGGNRDLFIMTLGDVKSPLAQGLFDPDQDRVQLNDGSLLEHYFRDKLGIRYYRPIDKSIFVVPPSGWCSWYFYFNEISEDEVRRNARWLSDNLKEYGLEYIQIDDGWQGVGRGMNANRDWTTINDRFPSGMKTLAADIKKLGFKPALWIAPHGQSNAKVVQANRKAFLLKPDGTTLSDTWEGTYLVDPSTDEGHAYLRGLFTTLSDWGYDYFKIDGQPCVIDEYRRCAGQMHKPSEQPVELYRKTLRTIHETIGAKRYLLGCWETPREGIGLTDGWRTGADVVPGWGGFLIARDATMGYYFLHNTVMYCDPDTVMVHSPLTIDQARAWATLQGLTGQALMASDRMMDLSSERVELYRRIYPPADIRPLDLFPSNSSKQVWDLKIHHRGRNHDRNYDVVGLFNYNEQSTRQIYLNWDELGITKDQPVHVYDFWNKEYLGVYKKGYSTEIGPSSCKVLTLLPATSEIQLISTSRHITQGWLDLLSMERDTAGNTFQGKSRVIKNDPYRLSFVFPVGKNFTIASATAGSLGGTISNHQGWATAEFIPDKTTEIDWTVTFAAEPSYHFPCNNPGKLEAVLTGLDQVTLKWSPPGTSSVGAFLVSLDGELLGATKSNSFPLRNLSFGKTYTVQVVSSWEDGTVSKERAPSLKFTLDSLGEKARAARDKRKSHD